MGLKTIGGIKKKKNKNGEFWELKVKEPLVGKLFIFPNSNKQEEWHDDYRICQSVEDDGDKQEDVPF